MKIYVLVNYNNIIDGLNAHQRAGQKAYASLTEEQKENRLQKIHDHKINNIIDGKNTYQRSLQKSISTMKNTTDDSGYSDWNKKYQKIKETMNSTIPGSNLTIRQVSHNKALETQKRNMKNGKMTGMKWHTYKDTDIKYQGSYELNFLESENIKEENYVKNS